MKFTIKALGLRLLAGAALLSITPACNELLDKEPILEITPQDYYKTADQLAAYLNNYYDDHLSAPYSGAMYHSSGYTSGQNRSDINTDIACYGTGSTSRYANNHWLTSTSKVLQSYYANIRVWNYFLDKAETNYANGDITGDEDLIRNYIGEAYCLRAICYFKMMVLYGDLPIITEVIPDIDEVIVEKSTRAPRNEVARFILEDLDKAISMLADRSKFSGQRLNKQAAQLFKSRVALFEATFEKYHRGSGRVPGDAQWPGASMSYNQGKTFDIDAEINFFLDEAMSAAKACVGSTQLVANNFVTQPKLGQITGWNPYFEMYSQPSLADVNEVLLWKQYNATLNIKHSAPYRSITGCNDGLTRACVEGFLMTDGLPFYASDLYQGDTSIDKVKADRDYRLQLFLWSESTLLRADTRFADYTSLEPGKLMGVPIVNSTVTEQRMITGYMSRKYVTYDYDQTYNDGILGTNACPIFRIAEAMLNYMEACYERTGAVDATADSYWRALRQRAGVNDDYTLAVAATDYSKELQMSVYSGTTQVAPLLFNIRRERMCETFNEGLRLADLVRWRSFDPLMTTRWIPEGCNFWDEMYTNSQFKGIVADGTASSLVSQKSLSKYLRPYSVNANAATNELLDGYTWHEAYYLYPLGQIDLTSASPDRSVENSNMYQNINWPAAGGEYCLK